MRFEKNHFNNVKCPFFVEYWYAKNISKNYKKLKKEHKMEVNVYVAGFFKALILFGNCVE